MTKIASKSAPLVTGQLQYRPKTDILTRIKEALEVSKKTGKLVTIQNEEIDRDMAEDLLSINKENRPDSQDIIADYAHMMEQGDWKNNGDPIRIREDFFLMDGQHRCGAIAQSGEAQNYNIVVGIKKDAMPTIDVQKRRTAKDFLSLADHKRAGIKASAIRLLILLKKGAVATQVRSTKVNITDIAKFVADGTRNKRMDAAIERAKKELHNEARFLKVHHWAALTYFLTELNAQKAEPFLTHLANGIDLNPAGKYHQIYFLYRRLRQLSPEGEKTDIKYNSTDMLMRKFKYIIKAWNAWVGDRRISELTLTKDDLNAKVLPIAQK